MPPNVSQANIPVNYTEHNTISQKCNTCQNHHSVINPTMMRELSKSGVVKRGRGGEVSKRLEIIIQAVVCSPKQKWKDPKKQPSVFVCNSVFGAPLGHLMWDEIIKVTMDPLLYGVPPGSLMQLFCYTNPDPGPLPTCVTVLPLIAVQLLVIRYV